MAEGEEWLRYRKAGKKLMDITNRMLMISKYSC